MPPSAAIGTQKPRAINDYRNSGGRLPADRPCDHSTQVLAILTVLINWNKEAKDIPSPAIVSLIQ